MILTYISLTRLQEFRHLWLREISNLITSPSHHLLIEHHSWHLVAEDGGIWNQRNLSCPRQPRFRDIPKFVDFYAYRTHRYCMAVLHYLRCRSYWKTMIKLCVNDPHFDCIRWEEEMFWAKYSYPKLKSSIILLVDDIDVGPWPLPLLPDPLKWSRGKYLLFNIGPSGLYERRQSCSFWRATDNWLAVLWLSLLRP